MAGGATRSRRVFQVTVRPRISSDRSLRLVDDLHLHLVHPAAGAQGRIAAAVAARGAGDDAQVLGFTRATS